MSECKSHAWDGIKCKNCKADIFDLYYDLRAKFKVAEESLLKINDIRNSIVGFQMINWSEHIYPLVAALNEAGVKGLHYPEAKANNGTMKEKITGLESQVAVMRGALEELKAYAVGYRKTWPSSRFIEIHQDKLNKAFESLQSIPAESVEKLQELNKYAELGRLAIETIDSGFTEVCLSSNVMNLGCDDCGWQSFCRKRAELLAEGCN